MRLRGLLILAIAVSIVKVESTLTECAPAADVNTALLAAERRAAESLGAAEAHELVDELKRSGTKQPDGTICFTDVDFERFGSLVSAFFRLHESEGTIRQQDFDFEGQPQPSPGGGSRCVCDTCPGGHESYCTKSLLAICCPHYCANIFSAVALAALSGIEGSGLDTCCEEGKKVCPTPQARQRTRAPPRKAKTGSTPPPELDFSDDEENVVFQTDNTEFGGLVGGLLGSFRGRRTVTPSPSMSPSPSVAYDDTAKSSQSPERSAAPSSTTLFTVTPSNDPTMLPTEGNPHETPVALETRNVTPSVSGPLLPSPSEEGEFDDLWTETLSGETQPDPVTVEVEEDIQESPEDLLRGS